MSTILDALRKVQRERDRESPDMRHAIVEDQGKPRRAFGPGHWLVAVGIALLAAGASGYLFLGGDLPGEAIAARAAGEKERVEPTAEVKPQSLRDNPVLRARVLEQLGGGGPKARKSRAAARRAAKKKNPRWVRPRTKPALTAQRPPAPEPVPELVAAAFANEPRPEPEATPRQRPVRVAAVGEAEREPEKRRVVRPSKPAPPEPVSARARAEPQPDDADRDLLALRALRASGGGASVDFDSSSFESSRWELPFPDLQLESVRWHPDSKRREARLLVDATRVIAAREGDIVVGVAVHRIDPGAVELRLGESRRLIRIGQ